MQIITKTRRERDKVKGLYSNPLSVSMTHANQADS